jgi:hypothetical protein
MLLLLLPCRLHQLSAQLVEREAELDKLHEQLQTEVAAANAKAAAQQSEMAGERGLLTKQAAAIDVEREDFKAWCAERKEEMTRQHKVGIAGVGGQAYWGVGGQGQPLVCDNLAFL